MEDNHCGQYIETPYEEFTRIGLRFKDGEPTQVIHGLSDMGIDEGLKLYKYGK